MKKILLIMLMLLPMMSWAQSKEADEYYEKGMELFKLEKYEEAIELFKKSDAIEKVVYNNNTSDYYRSEMTITLIYKYISNYYSSVDNYPEAIKTGLMAINGIKKFTGEYSTEYAILLNNLSIYYSRIGNYDDAIIYGNMALEIFEILSDDNDTLVAFVTHNLGVLNSYIGNYQEAIKLVSKAKGHYAILYGENNKYYAIALSDIVLFFTTIGNFTEAIELGIKAKNILKEISGEHSLEYATALTNLASAYDKVDDIKEAIQLSKNALDVFKTQYGENNIKNAILYDNIASYYFKLGSYEEAIKFNTNAINIYRLLGDTNLEYAQSLNNLAVFYAQLGEIDEAINLSTQTLIIKQKYLPENHPSYGTTLRNLSNYYLKKNDYKKASELFAQSYRIIKNYCLHNFSTMTSSERASFWNLYSDFFNNNLLSAAIKLSLSKQISIGYNSMLLSKGLLLNAELEIQKLIAQSGNKDFEKRYYTLRENHIKLDKLYQQPLSQRTMNVDSIESLIEKDQKFLMEHIKELGDYTRNLAIKWEDVQNKLSDKDIAIEFANFFDEDSKQEQYIALIVKKGMSSPELVKLFSSEQLAAINAYQTKNYNDSPTLYNLLWKPLDKYLQGVQNVYFSPSGKFHTIALEYLPDENGKIFAQKYNAYRLSSTRELVLEKEVNSNKKASVFGGIVYDLTKDDWQNRNTIAQENVFRDIPNISDSRGLVFNYLPHTVRESNEIVNILRGVNYQVSLGIAKNATEESFKKLSGSGIKILHIATHGYYEPENKEKKYSDLLLLSDKQNSTEDRSLSHSWLLFAGGTTILDPEKRNDIPEGRDDGILTAKEISRMDFKGLDLVVLSACQTALGKVTSEGVFGLQRGFKKAGAQTIVMSLWKVSDESTALLMIEFYKNLAAGQSKRTAFLAAQQKVRDKYPDPKHWAAFVMVDGLK